MKRTLLGTLTVVTAILVISVPAFAAVTTMQLSSWTPEFSDGVTTGGTQAVTLTNVTEEPVRNVSFSLDPVPCDCVIESYRASTGSLDRGVWTIERLESGATATLTVQYRDTTAVVAGGTASNIAVAGKVATAVSVFLLLAGLVLSRPDRFGVTTS